MLKAEDMVQNFDNVSVSEGLLTVRSLILERRGELMPD